MKLKTFLQRVLFPILFFLLGLILLLLVFQKQNWQDLQSQFEKLNYSWVIPIFVVSTFNFLFRSERWRLLLQTSAEKVSIGTTFWALNLGYFVNLALPRVGEISRCAVLRYRSKISFSVAFGTVVTERAADVGCLFLLSFVVASLDYDRFGVFFQENIFYPILSKIETAPLLLLLLVVGFGLLGIILWYYFKRFQFFSKVIHFFKELGQGILSIFKLQRWDLFLLYTLLIWIGYFLMTYLWFFTLPQTANLSPWLALAIMTVSSYGKSVPVQGGGMGAYHFLFVNIALMYGIVETESLVLAILIHGFQVGMNILLGVLAYLFLILLPRGSFSFSDTQAS